MEPIGPDVRRELARFGPAAGMAEIVEAWTTAVGEPIARNAWPARLARDRTLHVATSSAAWAFELAHLEGELLARLRDPLRENAPARLRFAVGRLPESAAPTEPVEKSRPEPSRDDRRMGAVLAAGIAGEELREAVARAAAHSLARASSGRPL
jgi:hypothetical protein